MNGKRMLVQTASRNVEHSGHELSCDEEHVGYLEQQSLRGSESGGERTCRNGPVHCPRRPRLRLHDVDRDRLAPDVGASHRAPLVEILSHCAGGGDRVNERALGKRIRNIRCCLIPVHRLVQAVARVSVVRFVRSVGDGTETIKIIIALYPMYCNQRESVLSVVLAQHFCERAHFVQRAILSNVWDHF